ncbi:unnamed protein product [Chrysoparadoxa australica]
MGRAWAIARRSMISRVLTVLAMILFNATFSDHAAGGVHEYKHYSSSNANEPSLRHTIPQTFTRWDSAWLLTIAEEGYPVPSSAEGIPTAEQVHAFLPLYPYLVSFLAEVLPVPALLRHEALVLWGVLVSNLAFVASALALYYLGIAVLDNEPLAFQAAQLYCLNPASVFFSAIYTESFFAATTFCAFAVLEGSSRPSSSRAWLSALLLSTATACRSNGTTCCVVFGLVKLRWLVQSLPCNGSYAPWVLGLLKTAIPTALQLALIVLPYAVFQAYCYAMFCSHKLPTQPPSWCYDSPPTLYGHVQSTYWGVGFLRYYQLKQVPNFLLAMPVLLISAWGLTSYVLSSSDKYGVYARSYRRGSVMPYMLHWGVLAAVAALIMNVQVRVGTETHSHRHACLPSLFTPLAYLLLPVTNSLGMLVCGCHQVSTRFLCAACPALHWFIALVVMETPPPQPSGTDTESNGGARPLSSSKACLKAWRLGYFFLGTGLHSNFYPWT